VVLVLVFALALRASLVLADARKPWHIAFSDGSLIQDFAWWDDDKLALLAVNPDGAILWLHRIGTNEREKLISATELEKIFGRGVDWSRVSMKLSPSRRYISFSAPPSSPLEPYLFKVVDLSRKVAIPVSFTRIPKDFVIGVHAWDSTDKYVYVAQREFLSPENDISLGRLSLDTGTFLGLAKKSDVDLIENLIYSPSDNALIIVSRSFQGSYPRNEFLLSFNLETNTLAKILEAYQFRGVQVTDSGEILVAVFSPMKSEGELFPGFLMAPVNLPVPSTPETGAKERLISQILLIPASARASSTTNWETGIKSGVTPQGEPSAGSFPLLLSSQNRGFDYNPYLSPSGRFIVFLRSFYRLPYAIMVELPENYSYLFVRERKPKGSADTPSTADRSEKNPAEPRTGRGIADEGIFGPDAQEFMVMDGADAYMVSPGERYLAARYYDKSYLRLFELPR